MTEPFKFPPLDEIDFDSLTDEEFEAFERTTLMAPDDLALILMDYRRLLSDDIFHNNFLLPRYGVLTLKARKTPIYCYAHPELKKIFPHSFNDGRYIFISDDFMRELLAAEKKAEAQHSSSSTPPPEGLLPVLLHHLMHMTFNHHQRFSHYHPSLVQLATDISVYCRLRLAFPSLTWVPELAKHFPAMHFSRKQIDHYAKLSEQTIILELAKAYKIHARRAAGDDDETLMIQPNHSPSSNPPNQSTPSSDDPHDSNTEDDDTHDSNYYSDLNNDSDSDNENENDNDNGNDNDNDSQNNNQSGKEKGNEKGNQSGKEKGNEKGNQSGNQSGNENGNENGNSQNPDSSPMNQDALQQALQQMGIPSSVAKKAAQEAIEGLSDHVTLQDSCEIMEDLGLDATKERLKYPDSSQKEQIEDIQKEIRIQDVTDITKSERMAGQAGARSHEHLAGLAHEEIKAEVHGQVSWDLGLQSMIGSSMNFKYSEAEPGDIYFIDPKDMNLNQEIYVGVDLPHQTEGAIIVILDTSGSVTLPLFNMFMQEIFGLVQHQDPDSETASEVYVFFADDVIRGEPLLITRENWEEIASEKINAIGRGGTNFSQVIQHIVKTPQMKHKQMKGLVYFTDLGDDPPSPSDVPPGVPCIFMCPPEDYSVEFAKAVQSFARVYPIQPKVVVDMHEDFLTRHQRFKEVPRRKFNF